MFVIIDSQIYKYKLQILNDVSFFWNLRFALWKFKIITIFAVTILAGMAKLVDVPDLGSGAARRVGSSPITRTESSNES